MGLTDFPADVQPNSAKVTSDGGCKIQWSDGHTSVFPKEFLEEHSFEPEARKRMFTEGSFPEEMWDAETIERDLPRADYK